MHELRWWVAIALTSVTALVLVVSMVGFFRARRGHMLLRLLLVGSITMGLVAVFAPLAGKVQIGEPAFAIGCGLLVMAQALFWWAVAAHGATRPSSAFAIDPPETLTVQRTVSAGPPPVLPGLCSRVCWRRSADGSALGLAGAGVAGLPVYRGCPAGGKTDPGQSFGSGVQRIHGADRGLRAADSPNPHRPQAVAVIDRNSRCAVRSSSARSRQYREQDRGLVNRCGRRPIWPHATCNSKASGPALPVDAHGSVHRRDRGRVRRAGRGLLSGQRRRARGQRRTRCAASP